MSVALRNEDPVRRHEFRNQEFVTNPVRAANGFNFTAYGKVIQHCSDKCLRCRSAHLSSFICVSSLAGHPGDLANYLSSKLVALYSKCGCLRLSDARQVFDEMNQKKIYSLGMQCSLGSRAVMMR